MIALILLLAQICFGSVFLISGLFKLSEPQQSRRFVASLFPRLAKASPILILILAISEIGLAVGLFLFLYYAALLGGLLLLLFVAILLWAIRRQISTPCGCFGAQAEASHEQGILRNAVLGLGMASFALVQPPAVLSPSLKVASAILFVVFGLVGMGMLSKRPPKSRPSMSRRAFLKISGTAVLSFISLLIPTNPTHAVSCCKCQQLDHFENSSCCDVYQENTIHHYFKRCCNTCTGQVGSWHKYRPDQCTYECPCWQPGSCDVLGPCTGAPCYQDECASVGCPY